MPNLSRVPLPSIALVLTSDHALIPRRPSVVKYANTPVTIFKTHPLQDSMAPIDLCDVDGPTNHENLIHECQPTSAEDDEHMDLAESIYDTPAIDRQERFVVVKLIKENIAHVLFSLRRFLCINIPQTCFPGVTRQ